MPEILQRLLPAVCVSRVCERVCVCVRVYRECCDVYRSRKERNTTVVCAVCAQRRWRTFVPAHAGFVSQSCYNHIRYLRLRRDVIAVLLRLRLLPLSDVAC